MPGEWDFDDIDEIFSQPLLDSEWEDIKSSLPGLPLEAYRWLRHKIGAALDTYVDLISSAPIPAPAELREHLKSIASKLTEAKNLLEAPDFAAYARIAMSDQLGALSLAEAQAADEAASASGGARHTPKFEAMYPPIVMQPANKEDEALVSRRSYEQIDDAIAFIGRLRLAAEKAAARAAAETGKKGNKPDEARNAAFNSLFDILSELARRCPDAVNEPTISINQGSPDGVPVRGTAAAFILAGLAPFMRINPGLTASDSAIETALRRWRNEKRRRVSCE